MHTSCELFVGHPGGVARRGRLPVVGEKSVAIGSVHHWTREERERGPEGSEGLRRHEAALGRLLRSAPGVPVEDGAGLATRSSRAEHDPRVPGLIELDVQSELGPLMGALALEVAFMAPREEVPREIVSGL